MKSEWMEVPDPSGKCGRTYPTREAAERAAERALREFKEYCDANNLDGEAILTISEGRNQ